MENIKKIEKACPKFETIFLGKAAPKDARLKRLKYWCSRFDSRGLTPCYGEGSFGNLSFRVKKGSGEFIITTSGLRLKTGLKDNSFFRVKCADIKRNRVSGCGSKPPSSESLLHSAIYKKRKDVCAIFHGHCMELLNAPGIPQTLKEEPYGSRALVKRVLKVLDKHNFIIMKNHGFISLGKNMTEAGRCALEASKRWKH